MGIPKTHKKWILKEENKLKKIYPSKTVVEIAKLMDRTECSITAKAKKLGLNKQPKDWLRKCRKCGLEAHTQEDLEEFRQDNRALHHRTNLCKKCHQKLYGWKGEYKTAREYMEKNEQLLRKKVKIMYRRSTINVPRDIVPNTPESCPTCDRKMGVNINRLNRHHWKYAYKTSEVKKHPELVLKNSTLCCFRCHRTIADPIRNLLEQKTPDDIKAVIKTMPKDMQIKFKELMINVLELRKEALERGMH